MSDKSVDYYTVFTFKNTKNMQAIIDTLSQKEIKIPEKTPLISIIILNKDGLNHLKRLFKALKENTCYPNYEIILVDNASIDDSLNYINSKPYNLSVQIIKNSNNVSFSKGNNQAAKIAKGEYLLLLNNDVEPTKGWLCEMMQTMLSEHNIGSVGAKLIYPYKDDFPHSGTIQHAGIAFRYEYNFYRPYNIGTGKDPLKTYLINTKSAALTAACLLISKKRFNEVNGLDEAYCYGYEDVDLGLKLLSSGYKNILCVSAVLFHYEFGTQNKDKDKDVRIRRLSNMNVFKKKWTHFIKKHYWNEKIENNTSLFSEKKLTIALAVTDAGDNVTEGDFFTAQELSIELQKLGYKIVYLRQKYDEWYNVSADIDIIINLLEMYDISRLPDGSNKTNILARARNWLAHRIDSKLLKQKITRKSHSNTKKIIVIAWARNWFDIWLKSPSFNHYDFVFASSDLACDYIKKHSGRNAILMPLATNSKKFNSAENNGSSDYQCDYCFTGSYWDAKREIITFINPKRLQEYKFKIYGSNWEKVKKLKEYSHGFLPYDQMPLVYANTKIVIDDANHATKPYGSVNSRVFDALASGTLVLTNGVLGSQLTFDNKLPSFTTEDELYELLSYYLSNEQARKDKVNELRNIVLQKHTYKHRAAGIKTLLNNVYQKTSIAIKMPVPAWDEVEEWGDYHFGLALKKEFEKLGYYVLLQILSEWENDEGLQCDIVFVLRGLSKYKPKNHQINIMWNISHPDKVTIDEYNSYDYVFIASNLWAEKISSQVNVPVEALLQCTDPDVFYKPEKMENTPKHELLFVGNSRKVFRKIIKDLLPTQYDLSIYGTNWDGLVDSSLIKDTHIPNKKLHQYYASAQVVLNDHWDDMREKGFISNRIFDALASGSFVVSDQVEGLNHIFQDNIVTYSNKKDLEKIINYYVENPREREKKINAGKKLVDKHHTFGCRVARITKVIQNLKSSSSNIKVKTM